MARLFRRWLGLTSIQGLPTDVCLGVDPRQEAILGALHAQPGVLDSI